MYMMNEEQRARLDGIDRAYKEALDYPLNLIQFIFGVKAKDIQIIDAEKLNENVRELEEDFLGTVEGAIYQCLFMENRGLYETAGYLSISAEWIHSISGRILRKMRHPIRSRPIGQCVKFD